jgi:hypothetical protein
MGQIGFAEKGTIVCQRRAQVKPGAAPDIRLRAKKAQLRGVALNPPKGGGWRRQASALNRMLSINVQAWFNYTTKFCCGARTFAAG